MEDEDELEAVHELDRRFPIKYGCGDLVGLGQFILNTTENPGDPETDAENIAISVIVAFKRTSDVGKRLRKFIDTGYVPIEMEALVREAANLLETAWDSDGKA